jgi:hypothetical protein
VTGGKKIRLEVVEMLMLVIGRLSPSRGHGGARRARITITRNW